LSICYQQLQRRNSNPITINNSHIFKKKERERRENKERGEEEEEEEEEDEKKIKSRE
jgi:hypothetical protein